MTPDLRAAFVGATYGTPEERFRLAAERGPAPGPAREGWAIVTAWNPGGQRSAPGENVRAAEALLAWVLCAGLSPLPAHNGEGEWREEALLVPGARLAQAVSWGAAFGQSAVLWGTGRRVALVWLDGEGGPTNVERYWAQRVEPPGPAQRP